jgi:quinol monooxygenase YgiN
VVTVGLFVPMKAKPGQETEVERFLESGRAMVDEEPDTTAWFAVRMGEGEYAIVDFFRDAEGRRAHVTGAVAEALMMRAPELFDGAPDIMEVDVIAAKLPG